MAGTLYIRDAYLCQTAAFFEDFDAIRYTPEEPNGIVTLGLLGGGTLDLSDELGVTPVGFFGSTGAVAFTSGAGHDSLFASDYGDSLDGGAGHDEIWAGLGADVLIGGEGHDLLVGFDGADHLFGGAGDDLLVWIGNDGSSPQQGVVIDGGAGLDTLEITTGSLTGLTLGGIEALRLTAPALEAGAAQLAGLGSIELILPDPGMFYLNLTGPGAADLAAALGTQAVTVTIATNGAGIGTGAGQDVIYGSSGDDSISGGAGDDTIRGQGGNDTLDGGDGHDRIIDTGGGRDVIRGGAGNDWITDYGAGGFHEAGVPLDIDAGAGDDMVEIEAGATAGRFEGGEGRDELDMAPGDISGMEVSGFEDFRIHGGLVKATAAQLEAFETVRNGIRSAYVCHIEVVDGGHLDLSEELGSQGTYLFAASGGFGNSLVTGNGHDFLYGDTGEDRLLGMGGNDSVFGGGGADYLDGGSGTNRLEGGAGDDTYVVRSGSDTVVELANAGLDTVLAAMSVTLGTDVENVVLTGAGATSATGNSLANRFTGNASANTLVGLGGNDILDGGAGADTMDGGAGHDTYRVDHLGDVLIEAPGGGTDTVETIFSTTLLADFENLTLLGSAVTGTGNAANNVLTGNGLSNTISGLEGNDTLLGGAGADTLDGGAGNDRLDGGEGGDRLTGGAGADTYVVDSTADVVIEASGGGIDTVLTSVGITLGAYVENVTVQGTAALTTKGNSADNVMTGNAAGDILQGQGGNDRLLGGQGADRLEGGLGSDILEGGSEADKFVFHRGGGADRVVDFQDNLDDLLFDDLIWGGGAKTQEEIMAYARLDATGAVFDFGGGHVVTVAGVTDLAVLGNDVYSV